MFIDEFFTMRHTWLTENSLEASPSIPQRLAACEESLWVDRGTDIEIVGVEPCGTAIVCHLIPPIPPAHCTAPCSSIVQSFKYDTANRKGED